MITCDERCSSCNIHCHRSYIKVCKGCGNKNDPQESCDCWRELFIRAQQIDGVGA